MKLFGEHDPTGGDGYVPGAWDEVRAAHLDGHISDEAYDLIRLHINPPTNRMAQAWDEGAERAFDSHAPEDLPDVLAANPHRHPPALTRPSTAFERPPGNVYTIPDDFPLEATERPTTIAHVFEIEDQ